MSTLTADPAAEAYAQLAPFYDVLTEHYLHEAWLDRLEELALAHGLAGRRVLDVGCGTGKSFMPLLARDYEVTGCDISADMLAVAEERAGNDVELLHADVRDLPSIGPFDLVTWLDDAANYLLGDDDLDAAICSIASTLAPGGLLLFDTNTLATHRDAFTRTFVVQREDVFLCWHGDSLDESTPGLPASATIEIFERDGACWRRRRSEHHQRWWARSDVARASEQSGLALVSVVGQYPGAVLDDDADEERHNKLVYVLRKPLPPSSTRRPT